MRHFNLGRGFLIAPIFAAVMALAAIACGTASESAQIWEGEAAPATPAPQAMMAPDFKEMAAAEVMEKEMAVEMEMEVPASAPAAGFEAAEATNQFLAGDDSDSLADGPNQTPSPAAQERIIIHTAAMTLVVGHIQESIDQIAAIAADSGGWVVSSQRDYQHSGHISVRVPAERLGAVREELRELADEVESEVITSEDVTDEYVDLGSRLTNQRRTETALLNILERAEKVEDALQIQQELSSVQENIERLQGRIKFLRETSAFSLISINLTLSAVTMTVDAGGDQVVSAAEPARFRATFRPPEGIDDFAVTWDFGDGADPVTVYRTAPAQEPGQRWTATVHHQYPDPKDSPYIVAVEIRGTGESGIAEGEDTLTVTALEVPAVQVFAGDSWRTARQGEEVKLSGSFTRPPSLRNVRFQWDPGDGSPPIEGTLESGETRASATHVYQDFREAGYAVTLTIIADSEVGEIREYDEIYIEVLEEPGFIVGGLEVGRAFKNAVRAFSVVVQGLFIAFVWLLIFSPLWIIAGGAWYFIRRQRRRNRANRTSEAVETQPPPANNPPNPETTV